MTAFVCESRGLSKNMQGYVLHWQTISYIPCWASATASANVNHVLDKTHAPSRDEHQMWRTTTNNYWRMYETARLMPVLKIMVYCKNKTASYICCLTSWLLNDSKLTTNIQRRAVRTSWTSTNESSPLPNRTRILQNLFCRCKCCGCSMHHSRRNARLTCARDIHVVHHLVNGFPQTMFDFAKFRWSMCEMSWGMYQFVVNWMWRMLEHVIWLQPKNIFNVCFFIFSFSG